MIFRTYLIPQREAVDLFRLQLPSRITLTVNDRGEPQGDVACENTARRFRWRRSDTIWTSVSEPQGRLPILGAAVQKLVGHALALRALLTGERPLFYAIDLGEDAMVLKHTKVEAGWQNMQYWQPLLVSSTEDVVWSKRQSMAYTDKALTAAIGQLLSDGINARKAFGAPINLRFHDFYEQLEVLKRKFDSVRIQLPPALPMCAIRQGLRLSVDDKDVSFASEDRLLTA